MLRLKRDGFKRMRKAKKIYLGLLAVFMFLVVGILGTVQAAGERSGSAHSIMLLNDVVQILAENYVDEIP